ncbi:MAG: sulfatase-like hydrolase/transferase [Deltaproteobacteria bacterium]|nr:sulfatase-like hydrolase/transferase [Deltaproteobacteria bacterium]
MTALQAADDTFVRRLSYRAGVVFAKLGAVDLAGGGNAVAGLPRSEITLAEALRVAGYRTMAVGKWHLGDFTGFPEYHPSNHGFDRFVGFNMSNDDWPVAFWRDDAEVVADIGLDQARYTALFTEEAVRFIEEPLDRPFFLYLAHKDPHQPFFPSAAFAGRSNAGPYGDAVSEFDWSVGEVIAALHRSGLAQNTLVVVTSDNGPWFEGSPGGLRGRKGQSYEGGFRVPFIAWWPTQIPQGGVSEVPAMNIDLFPTFLGLAGLALPDDRVIDGVDLWPVLKNQATGLEERPLYFFHDYDVEALRLGEWKYIGRNSHYVWPAPLDKADTPGGKLLTGRDYQPANAATSVPTLGTWPLLYNLRRDPEEAYNVAESHPVVVRELTGRLQRWRDEFRENPRGWH